MFDDMSILMVAVDPSLEADVPLNCARAGSAKAQYKDAEEAHVKYSLLQFSLDLRSC
jgi:hypothetical protein